MKKFLGIVFLALLVAGGSGTKGGIVKGGSSTSGKCISGGFERG